MNYARLQKRTAEFIERQLALNFNKAKAAPAIIAKHAMKAAAQLIDKTHNRHRKGRAAEYAAKTAAKALYEFFGYNEARAMLKAFSNELETAARKSQRNLI